MLYSSFVKELPDQDASSQLLESSTLLRSYQNCHSSTRIRAFLRLSRLASDDTLKEHLNETTKDKCSQFFKERLLPHWQARADLIDYCFGEAATLRSKSTNTENELQTNVALTIDPYAVKDAYEKRESTFAECLVIENWVNNERKIEAIIREHSADVLNEKCYYHEWLQDFKDAARRA